MPPSLPAQNGSLLPSIGGMDGGRVYRRLQLYEGFPTPGAYFGENSHGHVNIKPSFDTVSVSKLPLRPPTRTRVQAFQCCL